MSNQKTTIMNDTMQLSFFPEIHDKEPSKQQRDITPTFKEYNNKQVMVIYDIEGLFPY